MAAYWRTSRSSLQGKGCRELCSVSALETPEGPDLEVFLFYFLHSLQILRSWLQTETLKITGSSIFFLLVITEQNTACAKTDIDKLSLEVPFSGRLIHKS